jgi:hypothetical protein
MEATGLATYGGPEVLTWFDLPDPHAAADKIAKQELTELVASTGSGLQLFGLEGRQPYCAMNAAGGNSSLDRRSRQTACSAAFRTRSTASASSGRRSPAASASGSSVAR